MQIRVFNRQDDKELRGLLQSLYEADGAHLDLDGKDNDLRNVEGTYFGHDGIFLVAEEDGAILAFCGARRLDSDVSRLDSDLSSIAGGAAAPDHQRGTLKVTRKYAKPELDKSVMERMMAIVSNHAYQLDYKSIEITD
jgi:hypothetical protein